MRYSSRGYRVGGYSQNINRALKEVVVNTDAIKKQVKNKERRSLKFWIRRVEDVIKNIPLSKEINAINVYKAIINKYPDNNIRVISRVFGIKKLIERKMGLGDIKLILKKIENKQKIKDARELKRQGFFKKYKMIMQKLQKR